ncbi:hypothetical protein INT43_007565 [Umbelopsis isabellina]|uniref:Ornithine decarboxylase n=1 Tax=Mortierella isabellina TaxID=91625 RepID=A0A8H7PPH9_MORIS|nr:hypothetical protein INT43_007565 [Umbelopsis isabellina]
MADMESPPISRKSPYNIDVNKIANITVTKSVVDNVHDIVRKRLSDTKTKHVTCEEDNAFFIADHNELREQHLRWKLHLPRIEPFYAVKANAEQQVLITMASLAAGFDCASKGEIDRVLAIGVDPSRIIYAQTCKQGSYIQHCRNNNLKKMTFDNADELYKIKENYPDAELIIRILTKESKSISDFGRKFGASLEVTKGLLQLAKDLDLNVIGVRLIIGVHCEPIRISANSLLIVCYVRISSYHVGSGCFEPCAYRDAVERARIVFDQAEDIGYKMNLLDVGGGFPAVNMENEISFQEVASILNKAVDEMFPKDIRVVAEPGRFYPSSAFTLCTQIIARRVTAPDSADDTNYMYYVNDGIFGSFPAILFGQLHPSLKAIQSKGKLLYKWSGQKLYNSSIWGPSAAPEDVLQKDIKLPEMKIGDWLIWNHMGAYTTVLATEFNGHRKSKIYHINTTAVVL